MNKLKSNKGATSIEIIVYACIVVIMFTMGFVLKEMETVNKNILNYN